MLLVGCIFPLELPVRAKIHPLRERELYFLRRANNQLDAIVHAKAEDKTLVAPTPFHSRSRPIHEITKPPHP